MAPDHTPKRLKVAVVGVGRFGRFHARHLAETPLADLVAVVDTNHDAADAVAREYGCVPFYDHRDLIGKVDAASVVVPASSHFAVAHDLLQGGIDTLVEKPLCDDIGSAERLTGLAHEKGRILQVGHIERFSSCFRALVPRVEKPVYFECNRISPWHDRILDADVIFDMMIHDIDMIIGLAKSKVVDVSAVGTQLFSGKLDLANARLIFESGCVANITASRVSHKVERSLRVFQPGSYMVCDFVAHRIFRYSLKGDVSQISAKDIAIEVLDIPREDSLANEIAEFLTCVRQRKKPTVDGQAGLEAVKIAAELNASVRKYLDRINGSVID